MTETLGKEIQNLIQIINLNCSVVEFKDKVNWRNISTYQRLSEEFIREFKDKVDWNCISSYQKLSEEFIREFKDKVDWDYISRFQKLSEEFIREFKNKVYWRNISSYQKLSEEFIREFKDIVNWSCISTYQKLSEEFIRKFEDKVYWRNISTYQKLSEEFIREFKDEVDWCHISIYQKLSEEFIREFKDKVNWYNISKYQKLSEGFDLTIPDTNWLYKSDEFKLEEINKTGKYVIEDNCIIAYKGIRKDNYSKFNFQYKYEIGKTYISHCDCNIGSENSFGLSAWTLEEAREYCNEKIIKVKIPIDKLGCIVHNGNKLRCFEFTVIEEIE